MEYYSQIQHHIPYFGVTVTGKSDEFIAEMKKNLGKKHQFYFWYARCENVPRENTFIDYKFE